MNATTSKRGCLAIICLLSAISMTTGAYLIPVDYDFGTDPGKTTPTDAGFSIATHSDVTASEERNAIRFAQLGPGTTDRLGVLLQKYDNIGGTNTLGFTLAANLRVDASAARSWARWGINLFSAGPSSTETTGITGTLIRNTNQEWFIQIRNAHNGSTIVSEYLHTIERYMPGDRFVFKMQAEYLAGTDLRLTFTVEDSRGNTAAVSTIVNRTLYTGQYFGGYSSARQHALEFESFSIIPGPPPIGILWISRRGDLRDALGGFARASFG